MSEIIKRDNSEIINEEDKDTEIIENKSGDAEFIETECADTESPEDKKHGAKKWLVISLVLIVVVLILGVVGVRLKCQTSAYELGEKLHHVSNKATLSIDSLREVHKLEVIDVDSVVYITDVDNQDPDVKSWVKISGTGHFVVNMDMAEYIVDKERGSVLIRAPKPSFDADSIDITPELLYAKEIVFFYGNVQAGEQLAKIQLDEGKRKIQNRIESNEEYYNIAADKAKKMIKNQVYALNADNTDIRIDVEFYDE